MPIQCCCRGLTVATHSRWRFQGNLNYAICDDDDGGFDDDGDNNGYCDDDGDCHCNDDYHVNDDALHHK